MVDAWIQCELALTGSPVFCAPICQLLYGLIDFLAKSTRASITRAAAGRG
jgi:hypothetical protein